MNQSNHLTDRQMKQNKIKQLFQYFFSFSKFLNYYKYFAFEIGWNFFFLKKPVSKQAVLTLCFHLKNCKQTAVSDYTLNLSCHGSFSN